MSWQIGWWVSMIFVLLFLLPLLRLNILGVGLNKALSQESETSFERQRILATTQQLLFMQLPAASDASQGEMIPSLYQLVSSYRAGDVETAVFHLNQAVNAESFPSKRADLNISPYFTINPDHSISVIGNSPLWKKRSDSGPQVSLQPDGQSLIFSCGEIDVSPRANLQNIAPVNVPHHHQARLTATTEIGTNLALFTISNNQQIRQFVHIGTGQQETFEFTVEGDVLNFIYISIRDNDENNNRVCKTTIHKLEFLLDQEA